MIINRERKRNTMMRNKRREKRRYMDTENYLNVRERVDVFFFITSNY